MSTAATSTIGSTGVANPGLAGAGNGADSLPMKTLGQQDFLNLLVTQLKMQDPLNPKQDTDFIAQMAQFSALEQSKSMQAGIAQFQANSLIGRAVQLQNADGTVSQGVVSGVEMKDGTPRIVVNDQAFDLSQVLTIASPVVQPST